MIRRLIGQQAFNDGIARIYSTENIALPGAMPEGGLTFKVALRFKERTVGLGRFYSALQSDVKIDRLLRAPRREEVSTQDIAVPNDGKQYRITQVQYPEDVVPPVMDLSLSRLEVDYAFAE